MLGQQRDATAQRVTEHGDRMHAERIDHSKQVVGEAAPVEPVAGRRRGVTVTAEVERKHMEVRCQSGRERFVRTRVQTRRVTEQDLLATAAEVVHGEGHAISRGNLHHAIMARRR